MEESLFFYNFTKKYKYNAVKIKERDIRKYNKCKEHGIKLYYLTFEKEKYIPDNYFEKIYNNINELIKDIKTKL